MIDQLFSVHSRGRSVLDDLEARDAPDRVLHQRDIEYEGALLLP